MRLVDLLPRRGPRREPVPSPAAAAAGKEFTAALAAYLGRTPETLFKYAGHNMTHEELFRSALPRLSRQRDY